MDEKDKNILQKNEEELERARQVGRKNVYVKTICAVWFVTGLGCLFGGMFSGLSWLVYTGLGVMFGGALLLSMVILGSAYVKNAKKDIEKYGGKKTSYIMKGAVLAAAIIVAIAFGVCGFVLNEYLFIGAIVSFFAFVIVFFAWQP